MPKTTLLRAKSKEETGRGGVGCGDEAEYGRALEEGEKKKREEDEEERCH